MAKKYSAEFKIEAVKRVESTGISVAKVAAELNWISKYNGREKLKASGTGGVSIMTKGRKTPMMSEWKSLNIAFDHQNNYAETAQKYRVSYQQVYSWTCKFVSKSKKHHKHRCHRWMYR